MSTPIVAVVTGASSGLGEATARLLVAKHGALVVLVARREDRLKAIAADLPGASYVACDLTDPRAADAVRSHLIERHGGQIDLLVNNAGAAWRATFAEGGFDNVQRTMALNFDAVLRLTEVLLPMLRQSAPSAIVNVSSTAARVTRAGSAAYSASKAALSAWSDGLHLEEKPHGVHVGLVLPGFIQTEGFPATELLESAATRWLVSTPEIGAAAIVSAGLNRRAERYVPRPYALVAILKVALPAVARFVLSGGPAAAMTTRTGADAADARAASAGASAD